MQKYNCEKHKDLIIEIAANTVLSICYENVDTNEMLKALGAKEIVDENSIFEFCSDNNIHASKLLLYSIIFLYENEHPYIFTFDGEFCECTNLKRIYEILNKLGYEPADEEIQLIYGTHRLYTKEDK